MKNLKLQNEIGKIFSYRQQIVFLFLYALPKAKAEFVTASKYKIKQWFVKMLSKSIKDSIYFSLSIKKYNVASC